MSRFDELFNAAKKVPAPETEQTKSTKLSKSKDPNYIRTTVYLPKELHRQLKSVAVSDEQEMSQIVEESLVQYLKSRSTHLDV